MNLAVGLTGGIGSGKSTVAHLFAAHGATVIDSDEISRQLTQTDGPAIAPIASGFGQEYIGQDGALDRVKMRQLVFSDVAAKHRLEAILHPLILKQVVTQFLNRDPASYAVIVVPLLLENPAFVQLVQRVLLVDCDEQTQVKRVMQRSGLAEQQTRAIIASQMSRAERVRRSDDLIHNDAGLDSLARQVSELHRRYQVLSQQNID